MMMGGGVMMMDMHASITHNIDSSVSHIFI